MTKINGNDDSLAKFVQKAKNKLNKKADAEAKQSPEPKKVVCDYEFKKVDNKAELKNFEVKVKAMLQEDPEVRDPLGRLADQKIVEKLNQQEKSRYFLNLSKLYNKALEDLKLK